MEIAPPNRDWQSAKPRIAFKPMEISPTDQVLGECILSIVATVFDVTVEQLKGPRRGGGVALARFVAVALLLEFCPELSYLGIGRLMGDRDHTTIIHARRRAGELLLPDAHSASWRAKYSAARFKLTGEGA